MKKNYLVIEQVGGFRNEWTFELNRILNDKNEEVFNEVFDLAAKDIESYEDLSDFLYTVREMAFEEFEELGTINITLAEGESNYLIWSIENWEACKEEPEKDEEDWETWLEYRIVDWNSTGQHFQFVEDDE